MPNNLSLIMHYQTILFEVDGLKSIDCIRCDEHIFTVKDYLKCIK